MQYTKMEQGAQKKTHVCGDTYVKNESQHYRSLTYTLCKSIPDGFKWENHMQKKPHVEENIGRYLYDCREGTVSKIQNFYLSKVNERISYKLGKDFYRAYN